ncbi:MAG: hydrogenase nickel incorporation protein HypA [Candidatus Bathyarchaeota archaeon]|nr:hydrogenase nickel incorporation protein HypA [Candidatus Bathyarchaeota archaeon]
MHEWALAEGIIKTAEKFAEDQGIDEITEVKIMIGELQQVEHEIIEFALDQLRTSRMKSAKFAIETAPARFKCRKCSHEWQLNTRNLDKETGEAIHFVPEMAHVYLTCPTCGSPDFEVTEGRGVWLISIKGRKKE